MSEALPDIAAELRRQDHDRFLTVLFAPAGRRDALIALYAFNLEVARARERVSQPLIGLMRLQWWRDSIAGIYQGSPRHHAVVEPLAAAIRAHRLERGLFDRLIDAREADMDEQPPASLEALEAYASATSGALGRLAAGILAEGGVTAAAGAAADAAGTAFALAGLLRAVPFHARERRLYLPQSVIDATGLEVGALFELHGSPALREACRTVAERAEARLAEGRAAARGLPRRLLPALLPAVLARQHLRRLARAGYDPFTRLVQEPPPGRAWRLLAASLAGRI
ncbi:MAG: phytoene/squalene synthase family protein [Dongiaceae bacterium]